MTSLESRVKVVRGTKTAKVRPVGTLRSAPKEPGWGVAALGSGKGLRGTIPSGGRPCRLEPRPGGTHPPSQWDSLYLSGALLPTHSFAGASEVFCICLDPLGHLVQIPNFGDPGSMEQYTPSLGRVYF